MSVTKFLEGFYKEKRTGVYKIVFPDGCFYIGRSLDIDKRYSQHCEKLLKGSHHNDLVQKSFIKNNSRLPILEILLLSDDYFLCRKEGKIIEESKTNILCLNKYGSIDRTIKNRHINKKCIDRKITINQLTRKEFKYILDKYDTVDNALLKLLQIDN